MAKKAKVTVEPPLRRPRPPQDTTAGEAHEFIRGVNDLRYAIETMTGEIRSLRSSIETMDEHNAILCEAIERLADRVNVINGVGQIMGRLLPGGKRR